MIKTVLKPAQFIIRGWQSFHGNSDADSIAITLSEVDDTFRKIAVCADDQALCFLQSDSDNGFKVFTKKWFATSYIDKIKITRNSMD